ncbi:MAG: ImmA/IrrE family metallo-endopeptidase [Myxococcales bacterium]|nr:ImmA/IrrE family metallo-endopeptidase [Myxococcales bacterium]
MLKLNVPFLKPQELDSAAAELLRKYSKWKGAIPRPPIDIDDIVEGHLQLEFAVVNLQEKLGVPDVLGATWFDEKRVCVDESLEGQEGRFSFTLAHEVGHWVLHRPLYEADKVTRPLFAEGPGAKAAEPAVVCRSSQRQAPAEWQANQFAARVLMPASDVIATMRALCGGESPVWDGLRKKFEADEKDDRLRGLASSMITQGNFSNVSNEAMRRRLVDLKLVRDKSEVSGTLL